MIKRLFLLPILSIIVLFSYTGCAINPSYMEVEEPRAGAAIAVQVVGVETWSTRFVVKIRFAEDTKWDGLVQEVMLPNYRLVEYFKLPGGKMSNRSYDKHSISFVMSKHVRTMRLYPANVEGVDYAGNFAQLPENKDGSVVTKIDDYWNREYQWKSGPNGEPANPRWGRNHYTRGKIVSDDRENGSVWWSITHDDGILTITLPDGSITEIGNTVMAKPN